MISSSLSILYLKSGTKGNIQFCLVYTAAALWWLTWCCSGAVCPGQCCGPRWWLACPCSWSAPWRRCSSGCSAWGGRALTQMSAFHRHRSGTAWGNSHGPEDADILEFKHLEFISVWKVQQWECLILTAATRLFSEIKMTLRRGRNSVFSCEGLNTHDDC